MRKIRFVSFLLAAVLLLPTLFACKGNKDGEQTTTSPVGGEGGKVTTPYDQPDTEITDSPDGSTKVLYALSILNAGDFEGEAEQTLYGQNGTSEVTVNPWVGYEFIRWSDGNTSPTRKGDKGEKGKTTVIYAIVAPVYLEMPVLHLTTETGEDVDSKDYYINGTISITNCDKEFAITDRAMEIRGRGNNSWTYDKKSYHIKLNTKENLLGVGADDGKHWNLIANHCDQSLLRNYTALHFAAMMSGIAYSPASTNVEVYINGQYNGVYLLCEAIRVDDDRVAISEDVESGTDIGFLIQLTNYAEEPLFYAGGRRYEIKSDLSTDEWLAWEQTMFIEDYVSQCFDAVESGDRARIEELMDLNSIIDTYIVEETVKNLDVGWDSFYLYKDAGGKLFLGPVWDFDLSLGNANEGCDTFVDLYAAQNLKGQSNPWFYNLMAYHWFRELVAERWASKEVQDIVNSLDDMIEEQATLYNGSFCRNFEEWQIFGQCMNREPRPIMNLKTYNQHYQYLIKWLTSRVEWMNSFIGSDRYKEGYNTDVGGGIVIPPTPTPDPSYQFECSGGKGTASDPYLISKPADFMNFTKALNSGNTFSGKHFLQTANLDMTKVKDYQGIGNSGTFEGVYNGGGYEIHAVISGRDQCIFPYVAGLVMNLGTTGSVTNTEQAAGICRSIRRGGAIINCYSLMDVVSTNSGVAGGLSASTQSGSDILLLNCYFGGTVSGAQASPSNSWVDGREGIFAMLYSPNDLEAPNLSQSADVLLTRDEMKNTLADTLNGNINLLNDEYKDSMLAVAKKFGVSLSDLCSWKKGDPTPTLTHS
jgi:hypothetical protein